MTCCCKTFNAWWTQQNSSTRSRFLNASPHLIEEGDRDAQLFERDKAMLKTNRAVNGALLIRKQDETELDPKRLKVTRRLMKSFSKQLGLDRYRFSSSTSWHQTKPARKLSSLDDCHNPILAKDVHGISTATESCMCNWSSMMVVE
ncbi:hypothetical protein C349_06497 [Cryptococcus neoformans var. grubii Br795]|nr:hypothetical protein C349_06497 [Cryptococcus neoformans var. grubii Br795]